MNDVRQTETRSDIRARKNTPWRKMLCIFGLFLFAFSLVPVEDASAKTRKLKMYFLHTGERIDVAYKRNGKYLPGGLKKINRFLRDWRRNEPTKMDPKLLDLVWEVYNAAGGKKPIHVISAYRSQKTNNLLRKRGRGVAKKSQHSLGKALDFYIPGVKLSKLRAVGLKKGIGGVGYYPKSGSPFVHMDTGRVRHWPRMTRKQLVRVFPKGQTLHVPTDGKPLPGYNVAKSRYEKATRGRIVVAKSDEIAKKPGFFAKLLGADDDENDNNDAATAPKPVQAVRKPVPSGPVPTVQPAFDEPASSVVASLQPTGPVPVPIIAPRIGGTTVAPAGASIVDPVVPTAQDLLQEQQIASALPVPVPVRATRQPAAIDSVALVANAEPLLNNQTARPVLSQQQQVAALSANEIADLRKQVFTTIKTPVTARSNNVPAAPTSFGQPRVQLGSRLASTPRPSFDVPRPAANVPGSGQGGSGVVSNGSVGSVQTAQLPNSSLTGYATSETVVGNPISITPVKNPARTTQNALANQLAQQTIEAAREAKTTATLNEPETAETIAAEPANSIVLANVPVPTRKPQRGTVIATAKPEQNTTQNAAQNKAPVQVASQQKTTGSTQELSPDEIKSVNLNERIVGKWAFAANARIADIADIQPPAYGKNVARQTPSSVLSSGFSRETIQDFSLGFSGSSQTVPSFTNFNQ